MPDLSILILALNEGENLLCLLPQLNKTLETTGLSCEIIVVDGSSKDKTAEVSRQYGARVITQSKPGYANGLVEGLRNAAGDKIITLDADFSHPLHLIIRLLEASKEAELIVGSRYIPGSSAQMSAPRMLLSRFTNFVFKNILSIPVNDLTSGFRLYDRRILDVLDQIVSKNFDIIPELLLRIYAQGWKIKEIPFSYAHRISGKSHLNVVKFGKGYFKILVSSWLMRNTIQFADYDERSYDSWIPLQRYWQRRRYRIITELAKGETKIADLGCGSSRIIQNLPTGSVAFDLSLAKLRYLRKSDQLLVSGKVGSLPFKDASFDCLICSEVIEHIREDSAFKEFKRAIKPGGKLILGTPDYSRLSWRIIEFFYGILLRGGYKEGHIRRWDRRSLEKILKEMGFRITGNYYICGSELIISAEAPL